MATVSSDRTHSPGPRPSTAAGHGPVTRPNMASVGTIVWLSSELMFFAGLFAIYFTLRSVRPDYWEIGPAKLNVPFAVVNTAILVVSSIWCQLGVWAAERGQGSRTGGLFNVKQWGMREWFVLTYLFGAVFIAGQVTEYATLYHEGLTLNSDPYGSAFYLTTGFHGIHVVGGLLAFLLIIARSFTTLRYTHRQATGAIVLSYYWHFVDVVWIGLFSVIYLLR